MNLLVRQQNSHQIDTIKVSSRDFDSLLKCNVGKYTHTNTHSRKCEIFEQFSTFQANSGINKSVTEIILSDLVSKVVNSGDVFLKASENDNKEEGIN